MMASELLSVRVKPELAARVKVEASKDRRTVSSFVRNMLADRLTAKPAVAEHGADTGAAA
jgi:predicted HicB family RNase H-like nuclease